MRAFGAFSINNVGSYAEAQNGGNLGGQKLGMSNTGL